MNGSKRTANRKVHQEEITPSGAWMITFSDLCTLLLTFFVLILSMSSLNKLAVRASFRNFDSSVAERLFKEKERAVTPRDAVIREIVKGLEGVMELNAMDIDDAIEKTASREDTSLMVTTGKTLWIRKDSASANFSLIFGENLLFPSGGAELLPEAYPVLEVLGGFLHKSGYRAYVDGHTDDTPVTNDRFATNEELSLARAQSVLSFFVTRCNVSPRKLAMGGYGSTHPVAGNKNPAGRAMNRRVEIIFES
jgi:chemotaxis protein MotB